jgi:hypothetical protein
MVSLLLAMALAQEPESAEPVVPVDTAPTEPIVVTGEPHEPEVIVVYGDLLVERARQALISDLKEQGFTEVIDKGDYLLMRNEQAWKGDVIVHDDGWVRMKRQPAQFESPDFTYAKKGSALAWAHCLVIPTLCMRVGGVTLSRRRWMSVSEDTMGEISPDAVVFGDRVADRRVEDVMATLPDALIALWEQGTPLTEGPVLTTTEARKAAILTYWESRTDTIWGDRVRSVIDAFIRAEVQHSDSPFTELEIAAFNERRHCERTFDLERDWEAVFAADAGSGLH